MDRTIISADIEAARARLDRARRAVARGDLEDALTALVFVATQVDDLCGAIEAVLPAGGAAVAQWAAAVDRAVNRHRGRPSETPT